MNDKDASDAESDEPCPLCLAGDTILIDRNTSREFYRCEHCGLVHVPKRFFLSADEEFRIYELHENDIFDPGYRGFLNRLFQPIAERTAPDACGLDFGCGPGPALATMFRERGNTMDVFDPFYANHPHVLQRKFDFVTSTEVLEHLHHPWREIQQLWNCVRPGGVMGIMTKRIPKEACDRFSDWFYTIDPTHVAFYADRTFEWLAGKLNGTLELLRSDVAVIRKKTCES
ncbi:MAG: class I SAM-dependent methyltransferase [Planctomycetaceae bacterium]|nr:class I SAM-dependent methyltransferase [Planctomycetaceae bacterium]